MANWYSYICPIFQISRFS